MEDSVRQAWMHTVADYRLLQVKLADASDDCCLAEMDRSDHGDVWRFRTQNEPCAALQKDLQRIGTTALCATKALYVFDACVCRDNQHNDENDSVVVVQVIISLCHALSDGPGSLQIARSFLDRLDEVLGNRRTNVKPHRDLIDLQALLLGDDYGANEPFDDVFEGVNEYRQSLEEGFERTNGETVLPPERLQSIPSDPSDEQTIGSIRCVSFKLSRAETSKLRDRCRLNEATLQGALVAAALCARWTLLRHNVPGRAAVQIPVNTRKLANVDPSECLCGSAGVWHTLTVRDDWWEVAALSTRSTHEALSAQPREWLRRLFQAPQTLPPYSLMVSSIGVAPIENASYDKLRVKELMFFGAALQTSPKAQATMVHALTFDGSLTVMVNYTSPGVATKFAEETARLMKNALLEMVEVDN
jgi:hypothetical protein